VSEQNNLATAEPDRTSKLQDALSLWRQAVGARMPEPNLNYDPARAAELGKPRKVNQKRKPQP
jgi:hypothetical protein